MTDGRKGRKGPGAWTLSASSGNVRTSQQTGLEVMGGSGTESQQEGGDFSLMEAIFILQSCQTLKQ